MAKGKKDSGEMQRIWESLAEKVPGMMGPMKPGRVLMEISPKESITPGLYWVTGLMTGIFRDDLDEDEGEMDDSTLISGLNVKGRAYVEFTCEGFWIGRAFVVEGHKIMEAVAV